MSEIESLVYGYANTLDKVTASLSQVSQLVYYFLRIHF